MGTLPMFPTKNQKAEVVTNYDHLERLKYSPVLPRAFTEHGATNRKRRVECLNCTISGTA